LKTPNPRRLNWVKIWPVLYLFASLLISITITVRFFLPLNKIIQSTNYLLYIAFFNIIPVGAALYILLKTLKLKLSNKWFVPTALLSAISIVSILVGFEGISFPYEYLYLWIPVPLVYLLSIRWKRNDKLQWSKSVKLLVVAIFTIAILLPNLVTFVGVNQVLVKTESLEKIQNKISFINERVNTLTMFTWVFRASFDNWKFLLSGAGQCGEMAASSNDLMQKSGLTSRIVDIPGEHAFVEVKVNGEWMVADGSNVINRTAYGQRRIADPGSLSYAITETPNSFIELTQYYVNTDTIIINVTRNGEPVADASVVLVRSGTLPARLP
jgi:hypothetical protein